MTADQLAAIRRRERAALDGWKQAARIWWTVSRGAYESTRVEDTTSVLVAQATMRQRGQAWAEADRELRAALDVPLVTRPSEKLLTFGNSTDHAPSSQVETLLAVSSEAAESCRCYSLTNSSGEIESARSWDCPTHGATP
jgi:hypothetical protein